MTPRHYTGRDRGRVRIPADVERPDKLLAGLTARQLAILGVAAVVLWAGYAATRHLVPTVAFAVVALPVGAAAAMLALGRFEGVAADRWVSFAWRHHRAPHRLVPAPDGVPSGPAFLGAQPGSAPDTLRLPFAGVGGDGIVDLGVDGLAMICRASAVTFSLRTPAEQEALVAGFARWLNSLDQAAQILVRAEPVDLTGSIDALLDAAPALPHPALETAARGHAAFLADLGARRDLLRREVLVVLRQPSGTDAPGRLHRRAAEATRALGAAGVTLVALDGSDAATCLARALDPAGEMRPVGLDGTALSGTEEPVTVARPIRPPDRKGPSR
ncbi:MAG: PrgI family protein [Acidimicrobiales bacterium]|nr:PrgI family protein [Acidimicrobiales bacterium]